MEGKDISLIDYDELKEALQTFNQEYQFLDDINNGKKYVTINSKKCSVCRTLASISIYNDNKLFYLFTKRQTKFGRNTIVFYMKNNFTKHITYYLQSNVFIVMKNYFIDLHEHGRSHTINKTKNIINIIYFWKDTILQ